MPHVDIKCFPRELTDEQKTALAADITDTLVQRLPESSYRLLPDGSNGVLWYDATAQPDAAVLQREPQSGWWRRMWVKVLSWLPLESML